MGIANTLSKPVDKKWFVVLLIGFMAALLGTVAYFWIAVDLDGG